MRPPTQALRSVDQMPYVGAGLATGSCPLIAAAEYGRWGSRTVSLIAWPTRTRAWR